MRTPLRAFLLAALAACVMSSTLAATYYVRQKGDDLANGLTPAKAFRTVVRAAQAINHGDTVVIGPGSYTVSAFIADRWGTPDARLNVIGDETGKQTGDASGAVVIQAASLADPALAFFRCKQLTVSGLTFRGPGQGLKLEKCSDVIVKQCSFESLARGLAVDKVDDLHVGSSVFTRCAVALFVGGANKAELSHLSVAGSTSTGILILSCGPGSISSSLFANNNTNFVVDEISAPAWTSDNNILAGATGPWGGVPTVNNIYEWSSASGQDRHSVYVVPQFTNPKVYDLHIAPAVTWGGGLPGMSVGKATAGELDRDGKPFRLRGTAVGAGAYDYPDPQPANGWKRLNVKMPNSAIRQSAGVYQEDGILVRTLLADATGVQELWWNGLDDLGAPAPAGKLQVRAITHDVRVVDDGSIGDNGNPKGVYNCDNADRVIAMPDGGFFITAVYDEAGFALRRYSASGQSTFASSLQEASFWGLARYNDDIIGGAVGSAGPILVRLAMPGERAPMANGTESYSVLTAEEKNVTPMGLAIKGDTAYAALGGLNVVRAFDLRDGKVLGNYPVPAVGDIVYDGKTLWALSGTDIVSLTADGKIDKRYPTALVKPQYLAAKEGRLVAVDRKWCKLTMLNSANGEIIKSLGVDRADTSKYWLPVKPDTYRDPRGAAFLADGRLVLTENSRVRIFSPENPVESVDLLSNFMETAVVHPTQPDIVYCGLGIFRVDPKTGVWQWLYETPTIPYSFTKEEDPWNGKRIGSPGQAAVLGGRPFILFLDGQGVLQIFDVVNPLQPRKALEKTGIPGIYNTAVFGKDGDLVLSQQKSLAHRVIKFIGLDKDNNPTYDFASNTRIGPDKDPSPRNMRDVGALTADRVTGEMYYLASTDLYCKMVPGWGADGTGVGKSATDGKPLWYSLSSGGNYMSISAVNDGKRAWVFAGKSFGGQLDLFDSDGLRITTGNWSFPSGYSIGFVDLRYGVHAYMRPDGKAGAYVEDDAIGRFARARVDSMETLQKQVTPITWDGQGAPAAAAPASDRVTGEGLARQQVIPKVAELPVNGDWSAWEKSGVVPQIVALPSSVGFKRTMADNLLQTFNEGTMIGALAHDGKNLYTYIVVADNTPHFDAKDAGQLWMFDGIEFWVEEEQIGLGLLKDGTPGIFKWRFHNKAGEAWKANYALPREDIWAVKIADLSTHPLGRQLAAITGTSFNGKPGFAVMGKIPFEEIKLVGGIAGREGEKIYPMTGQPGEVLRIAISLNNISAWGRVQDYMVDWPVGKMYSDPTRSYPFVLGE